jgi:hypothetical protein
MRCGNLSDLEKLPDQLTEELVEELASVASSATSSLSVFDEDPDEALVSSSFSELDLSIASSFDDVVNVGKAGIDVGELSPGASFPVVFLGVDGGVFCAASAMFVVGNCFASSIALAEFTATPVCVASLLLDPFSDVDVASSYVLDSLSADMDKLFFAAFLDSLPSALGAAFCLFEPSVDVDAVPLDVLDFFLSVLDELFFAAVLDRVSTVGVAF